MLSEKKQTIVWIIDNEEGYDEDFYSRMRMTVAVLLIESSLPNIGTKICLSSKKCQVTVK